ncbi:MAG: hypothetical protein ABI477_21775, partial [Chryseolinea sp.]
MISNQKESDFMLPIPDIAILVGPTGEVLTTFFKNRPVPVIEPSFLTCSFCRLDGDWVISLCLIIAGALIARVALPVF